MQGSVSLGKDVVDTISYYLQNNDLGLMDGRRTFTRRSNDSEAMEWLVRYTYLCKGVPICDKPMENFVNEYVTAQVKAVEKIIYGSLPEDPKSFEPPTRAAFEEHAKDCLFEIKHSLQEIGEDKVEHRQSETWLDLVKKISSSVQTKTVSYLQAHLEGNSEETVQVKKNLTGRIILGTVLVEVKYETKLCKEFQMCSKSYEITSGLMKLLESFETLPEDKLRLFMKAFYQSLYDTNLYSILNEVTRNEFQFVLNDMAFSANIPARNVLMSLKQAVQKRLDVLQGKDSEVLPNNYDVQLVNIILSDMDHLYLHAKRSPFFNFFNNYENWTQRGGNLKEYLKAVMQEIAKELEGKTPSIKSKLINEVQLFLQLTIEVD